MAKRIVSNRLVWRLWLVVSFLFLAAAWRQPSHRIGSLALGFFFAIVALRLRPSRSD